MSGFPYLARNGCGAELRLGIFTNEADEQEQLQEACSLNRLDLPSRSSSSLVSGPRPRPMSMPMPMHMPRSSSSATAAITAMAAPVQLDLLPLHGRLRSRNRESSPSASTPMALPWMRASSSPSPSPWPGSAELGEMRLQHGQSSSSGRGIDMNQVPSFAEEDEVEATVSSPNSTVSSFQMDAVSGNPGSASRSGSGSHSSSANNNNNKNNNSRKRERDECNADAGVGDNEQDRACSRASDEEEGGDATRKKLRLSKEQSALLEESFKEHNTLNPKQKLALAKQLNLRPRQVEVWFQNRRARTKLKQTEVDCEFLKRCCENLTEENRRLQKEVQELRALKMATPLYMQMPAATLTMCPSCERIATATADTHRAQAQAQAQAQPPTNHIQRRTPWQAALVPNTSRAFQSSVRS